MIIYKCTNNINNKIYIGLTTKTLEWRIKKHKDDYKRKIQDKNHLYRAMRKYGFENFSWEIIDTATTKEELSEKERYWIKYYDCFDNKDKGYNSTSGGETCYELTEEQRRERSERVKGEKNPMYGVPSPMKGKSLSSEHKAKISEALKKSVRPHVIGSNNPSARKVRNVDTGETFNSMKEASEKYPSSKVNGICSVCKGRSKTCGGYRWEYV